MLRFAALILNQLQIQIHEWMDQQEVLEGNTSEERMWGRNYLQEQPVARVRRWGRHFAQLSSVQWRSETAATDQLDIGRSHDQASIHSRKRYSHFPAKTSLLTDRAMSWASSIAFSGYRRRRSILNRIFPINQLPLFTYKQVILLTQSDIKVAVIRTKRYGSDNRQILSSLTFRIIAESRMHSWNWRMKEITRVSAIVVLIKKNKVKKTLSWITSGRTWMSKNQLRN